MRTRSVLGTALALVVQQSMNTAQFRVEFDDDSTMTLFQGSQQVAALQKQ